MKQSLELGKVQGSNLKKKKEKEVRKRRKKRDFFCDVKLFYVIRNSVQIFVKIK